MPFYSTLAFRSVEQHRFSPGTSARSILQRKQKASSLYQNFKAKTVGGLGHSLIQYADSLAAFDYSMSDSDAERLSRPASNGLKNAVFCWHAAKVIGPYKSVLSEVGSHVVTNENNPRQTYRNLGMWPLEETDEWRDLAIADISNWLGMDRHSQNIPMAESHQIVYRDFLDYVLARLCSSKSHHLCRK